MDILSQVHLNYHPLLLLRGHYSLYFIYHGNQYQSIFTHSNLSYVVSFLHLYVSYLNPKYLDFGLYPIYIYFSRVWESQNGVFKVLRVVRRKLMTLGKNNDSRLQVQSFGRSFVFPVKHLLPSCGKVSLRHPHSAFS